MPFTTDLNKYLNRSPIRHLQDLYTENYKMLMKKILKVPNKQGDIPCSWIRKHNIIKMSILPKLTGLTQLLLKCPQGFCGYRQAYSKIYMVGRG